ncbi:MAG: hypothetical protein ACHQ1H_05165 [Nitrososphaerales archaeon]
MSNNKLKLVWSHVSDPEENKLSEVLKKRHAVVDAILKGLKDAAEPPEKKGSAFSR